MGFVLAHALVIFPPLFALSLVLLVWLIRDLIATGTKARLVTVSVAPAQEVEIAEKGRVVLCTEGPIFSRGLDGLSYELALDGRPVPARGSLFKARTRGFSRERIERAYFDLPVRGRYTLYVRGLAPEAKPGPDCNLVFMRPHLAGVLAHVSAIILAAGSVIVSLVFSLLALFSPESLAGS